MEKNRNSIIQQIQQFVDDNNFIDYSEISGYHPYFVNKTVHGFYKAKAPLNRIIIMAYTETDWETEKSTLIVEVRNPQQVLQRIFYFSNDLTYSGHNLDQLNKLFEVVLDLATR